MAIVKNPLHSDDAAGKIGWAVHRKSRGLHIVQHGPVKLWVDTEARAAFRAIAAEVSAAYNGLNEAEKRSWELAAPNFHNQHRLSKGAHIDGQGLFTQRNHLIRKFALPLLRTFPPMITMPQLGDIGVAPEGNDFLIEWVAGTSPPGHHFLVIVWIHGPIPGAQRAQRRAATYNVRGEWWDPMIASGPLPDGRYGIWARLFDAITGQLGPESFAEGVISF